MVYFCRVVLRLLCPVGFLQIFKGKQLLQLFPKTYPPPNREEDVGDTSTTKADKLVHRSRRIFLELRKDYLGKGKNGLYSA